MQTPYRCHHCDTDSNLLFCKQCSELTCLNCTIQVTVEEWYCRSCQQERVGEQCGTCGASCVMTCSQQVQSCSTCGATDLEKPDELMQGLPQAYYDIITGIMAPINEFDEVHAQFISMVSHVRACRLGGLLGYPEIEKQLRKIANGLLNIAERGKKELKKLHHLVSYDILRVDGFAKMRLEHYRSAAGIFYETEKEVNRINKLLFFWVSEVRGELELVDRLVRPLTDHYLLWQRIYHYLQKDVSTLVGLTPPITMSAKHEGQKYKGDCYIIYNAEKAILLPTVLTDVNDPTADIISFPYEEIKAINSQSSIIKGEVVSLDLQHGSVSIYAPPKVLEKVVAYFKLVWSTHQFMVSGPKDIKQIDAMIYDRNDYLNAVQGLLKFVRNRLFGITEPESPAFTPPSYRELREHKEQLEQASKQIDMMASSLSTTPSEYELSRSQIKESLRIIRENLEMLGGHLAQPKYIEEWMREGDTGLI